MLAVESFRERVHEGRILRVTGSHADPRDRLQNGPMPAYRADKRERNQSLADLSTHRCTGIIREPRCEVKCQAAGPAS